MFIKVKRQLNENISVCHDTAFKALRFDMYHNPSKYPTTGDMADFVHLSRSHFSTVYKKLFHVSPKEDMICARISKAPIFYPLKIFRLQKFQKLADIRVYIILYANFILLWAPRQISTEKNMYKKKRQFSCRKLSFLFGGEKGIRTLDGVLAHTRFPVVRLRPAQPSLHATYIVYYKRIPLSILF